MGYTPRAKQNCSITGLYSLSMLSLIFGAFGLIIGSFLNVLIGRWGTQSLSGRSMCPSCGHTIRWYDLVPILSWFLLHGRCRDCKSVISLQYPIVEVLTAILFLAVAAAPISLSFKILALPIVALLLAIAIYDFYTTIIPDLWAVVCGILSLGAALYGAAQTESSLILVILAGPAVALPLFTMWIVSSGKWMGLGDAKLALSLGWLLGISGGMTALLLAFVLGAILSVPLLFLSSPMAQRIAHILHFETSTWMYTMKSEVPFGPFLVASCFFFLFSQMYGFDMGIWNIAL